MRTACLVMFSVVALCFAAPGKAQSRPANPANQPGDSITLVSVETEETGAGQTVQRGHRVAMIVTVRYTLASHDSAVLSISTAQFHDPQHCTGDGELVDAQERVVYRGSGTVSIPITWSGDTGEHSKGRIFGSGSLSFMGMFWVNYNGKSRPRLQSARFGLFDFYNDYCVAF